MFDLTHLNLAQNKLTRIGNSLANQKKLKTLNLAANSIEVLEVEIRP